MKNPYAPGFWCAVAAVVLLSATYFYGIMLAHQIDKAMIFLDSASALIAVLAIVVVACASVQTRQIKKTPDQPGPDPRPDLGHQGCPAAGRDGI
jgi:hypothetical protein